MIAYLVPVSDDRFELYSEHEEEPSTPPRHDEGRLRHWVHTVNVRWRDIVEGANHDRPRGRFAHWRDEAIRRLAESIAEQRTLWHLRHLDRARLKIPAFLGESKARGTLDQMLDEARRHHRTWFWADLVGFLVSGVLALVPGPNVLAYYLALRVAGHLQSWRGATHALRDVSWELEPDPHLSELAGLTRVSRHERALRVAEIEARLQLRRLAVFFERVVA
jgi:hypothetical protein